MNTKEKESEESKPVPNTSTTETEAVPPLNNDPLTPTSNPSENVSPTAEGICENIDIAGTATERAEDTEEVIVPVIVIDGTENSQVLEPPPAPLVSATVASNSVPAPPPPPPPPPPLPSPPLTTETACGPGDSSTQVNSSPSDPQDQNYPMNRLSRVSRVLMPIQQLAEASTQMYPALFHPIGASGVIIYSDGSTTDVSGLTIPYLDPIRELTAGLMSVTDPGGEHFEWNSLLESDTSHMSHSPGNMGEDYYIATYVDPEENSSVLFTSMDPVSEVPYTTLEVLDGVEIDSTRGIVISARPPPHVPTATPNETCVLNSEATQEREVAVSDPTSHPEMPVTPTQNDTNQRETPPRDAPDDTKPVKPQSDGGCP